jgi:hypothetical protein
MLVYGFGTENDISWKGTIIDDMEESGEDLSKAFAFAAEGRVWALT